MRTLTYPSKLAILVMFVVVALAAGLHTAVSLETENQALPLVLYYALFSVIAEWIRSDSHSDPGRMKSFGDVFEFDFLFFLAWPIMVPYYLLTTRGRKAVGVLLIFPILYMLLFVFSFLLARLRDQVH